MKIETVEEKIKKLPDQLIPEINDFIDFLISRYGVKEQKNEFTFDWEGGLINLKNNYTSVELQHQSAEWR